MVNEIMQDKLGNVIEVDDTVIVAVRSGRVATLGQAYVKEMKLRPQFQGGAICPMINVQWSNIHNFWMPARNVIKLMPEMIPENRRKKYDDTEEGIEVSNI